MLGAIADRPVLTIGDVPEFAPAGTMIAFTLEQNKVRFVVNVAAAERARLKISSQLLKLAVVVLGGTEH